MRTLTTVGILAISAGALFACSETSQLPTSPDEVGIQLAKPGGGSTDPTVDFYFPVSPEATTIGVWSDGGYVGQGIYPDLSIYKNGHCGVEGKLFATGSGSGDATLNLKRSKGAKCDPFPRTLRVTFDGLTDQIEAFLIVDDIHPPDSPMPINGEPVDRGMNIRSWTTTSRCEFLKFRQVLLDGTTSTGGGDWVKVQRLDKKTWHVWNETGANNAQCVGFDGSTQIVSLPVDFYLVASEGLPEPTTE